MSRDLVTELAPYLRGLTTDPDLIYQRLRSRRRRRRTAGAAVATAIAAAVLPVLHYAHQAAARRMDQPAAPPPSYTHANGVRGSLGGDQQVLDAAKQAISGSGGDVDTARMRPLFAERAGTVTYVLFTGPNKQGLPASAEAFQVAGGPWRASLKQQLPKITERWDTENAEKLYGEPFWAQSTGLDTGGQYLTMEVILVPDGTTAVYRPNPTVAADGTLTSPPATPLTLHAGTLLIDQSSLGGGGTILLHRAGTGQPVVARGSSLVNLSPQSLAVAAALGRGHPAAVSDLVLSAYTGPELRTTGSSFEVVWSGSVGAEQRCSLGGARYRSGAHYSLLACGGNHWYGGPGLVPAGTYDRTLAAFPMVGSTYGVMAPPGAVRAEFVYASGPVSVGLTDGFGYHNGHAVPTLVRVYDAAGALLDQRAPQRRPLPVG